MLKLSTNELRRKWISFFESKQHLFLEPVSLIPNNDPSLLWINSGVATLKDYFSGKINPPSNRLVNSQKAIRTNDIFNVGLTSRHHTFFEMLGNFSIGDYFKETAIEFAYEFLINELKVDLNLLWFTVFEDDEVAYNKWISLGVDQKRIIRAGRDRNFWDVGSGPCGPCTEIHYDRGTKYDPNNIGEKLILEDIENDRYVEIWNVVFSQFNNDGNNNYTELKRKNIDTGAGLERIACISQDVPTNFDTDVFQTIIKSVEKHSQYKYDIDNYFKNKPKQKDINFVYKVIADHIRASVFAIADGAIPSNKERGYILRRLIRRAMVYARKLEIFNSDWLKDAINAVVVAMGEFYTYLTPELVSKITSILIKEYNVFEKTLQQGMVVFENATKNSNQLDKHSAFKLVDTYGFPIELIKEISKQRNIEVDLEGFEELFKQHQIISNANKNDQKAMEQQNNALMNLEVDSKFVYDTYTIDNAKIIKIFDADFNEVNSLDSQNGYVVFDQTCFYATSGGQIHDSGYIEVNGSEFSVLDVIKAPNLQHIHFVENASLNLNDNAKLKINQKERDNVSANHSAEHLLHYALKQVVNASIKQEGAAKYPYKVSFDFTHYEPLDANKLKELENYINNLVNQNFATQQLYMELEEAKAMGAMAYFGEVYKKIKGKLRVVKIGPSIELCGGTHVINSKDIEQVKIIDCTSKGSGSWRITMVTKKQSILDYINNELNEYKNELNKVHHSIKNFNEVLDKEVALFNDLTIKNIDAFDTIQKQYLEIKEKLIAAKIEFDKQNAKNEILVIKNKFNETKDEIRIQVFNQYNNKNIFNALNELINEQLSSVFVSFNVDGDKIQYLIAVNEKFAKQKNINLNNWIKLLNNHSQGKGGGKPHFVQGGCSGVGFLDELLNIAKGFKV